jgi:surfactin synthase thioesterase subunit
VQLPGREGRLRSRRPIASPLFSRLAAAIRPLVAQPYAIFGHSMGALLA